MTIQTASHIAQKLRDAGLGCEVVNLVPAEPAVFRRDRIAMVLALAILTALAWSYFLWLSADVSMGGMDMTGFRERESPLFPYRLRRPSGLHKSALPVAKPPKFLAKRMIAGRSYPVRGI